VADASRCSASTINAFGKVLLPHVMARTKVIKDGKGKYLLRVVDEGGDERFDSSGKPMTVAGLVAEMRQSDDYGFAFDHDRATGPDWSRINVNPWFENSFNATEQAAIMKTAPALARQLQQESALQSKHRGNDRGSSDR
jgi:hypothetical protein